MNHFTVIANTDAIMHLSCTCQIQLWKLLLVTADQYKKGRNVLCPEHGVPHDFSCCPVFKDIALSFAEKLNSDNDDKNEMFFTFEV